MKVSMIPDNSVKMIHASQDDVGRRWEFELYDEDGLIDVSSVGEQMVYPVYQGGTEQILPENTSTPTTSPILADIIYPDEERTDQEFLYRECPSVEDGQARIKRIKGNTVKFNQLAHNGNFNGTTYWTPYRNAVLNVANNIGTVTCTADDALNFYVAYFDLYKPSHKYYFAIDVNSNTNAAETVFSCIYGDYQHVLEVKASELTVNQWNRKSYVLDAPNTNVAHEVRLYCTKTTITNKYRNIVFIDLTDMFGNGNEPTTQELEALFSLPYYAFNSGTLLPFMGESIKTTGKNLLKINVASKTENGVTFTVNEDGTITANGTATGGNANFTLANYLYLRKGTYVLSGCPSGGSSSSYSVMIVPKYSGYWQQDTGSGKTFTMEEDGYCDVYYARVINGTTVNNLVFKPMIRFADVEDDTFEPYHESIVNLPTLTYFADGMKSAGSVYDELTENKAVQRIEKKVLDGSFNEWSGTAERGGVRRFYTYPLYKPLGKVVADKLISQSFLMLDSIEISSDGRLGISPSFAQNVTTIADFKSLLASNPITIHFELAEPVETPIASASLVSQNQEIPMSVEDDKLIAYSTQEITENSGFHDAKIKLSNDGVAYSAKFTLHVERKP